MEFKDYYSILGVGPDADEKAIRSAFRKLAREHHPDVNPGNNQSAEKFKDINEANQVLSDKEQRRKYDEMRAQYLQWQKSGGQARDFDYDRWQAAPGAGPNVRYASPEDVEDMFGGDAAHSDFFETLFGRMRQQQANTPRQGRDLEFEVEVTLEEAFHGAKRLLQIGERRIEAAIPRGVYTGARVRLAGQGEPGRAGAGAGDLYLVVHVLPHKDFEREGDDLYRDIDIDMFTAALGGEARVPTLDGAVMLNIPARTQAGRSFRLRGKGMPHLGDPTTRGDLYARARIVLPDNLTDKEIETLKDLKASRSI
jgi:curved DNA-binding protein